MSTSGTRQRPAAPRRSYTAADRLVMAVDGLLRALAPVSPPEVADYPAETVPEGELAPAERRHAAGLMRVNHAGEVCAQALYHGQALSAREPAVREHLRAAAAEEAAHLAWCARRLEELGERPSALNPLWYTGSLVTGAAAGLAGDRWSLGFVVETERQVEAHLGGHLERLPCADERSRAIVRAMQADERRHGRDAARAGGAELPGPVSRAMALQASLMTRLAYHV